MRRAARVKGAAPTGRTGITSPRLAPRQRAGMLSHLMLRALVFVLLFLPSAAFAWGFDGHRRLAANLHEPFPQNACLRAWLSTVTGTFAWQDESCEPDRWRGTDPAEWPRHYLDIDYASPISSYPREWPAVQAQFQQYAEKNGTVPFRVEEMYGQLVAQMKAKDSSAALLRVAYLSHYVTDAFSPMHDTKNQPGNLHIRYESDMLGPNAQINEITTLMRGYYGTVGKAHPKHHIFDAVIAGHPVAIKLIDDDTAAAGSMTALYANTKELTARRWGDSVTVMASLIGTAWVEAGAPMLAGMPSGCDANVAQGQLSLKGFALPAPTWDPDAGTVPADGGVEDAGSSSGDGGGNAPWTGYDAGQGAGVIAEAPSCGGCGGMAPAALLPMVLVAIVLPLRRKRQ